MLLPLGFFFGFLLPQKLFFINQLFLRASFVSFSQVRCFCFSRCASRRKETMGDQQFLWIEKSASNAEKLLTAHSSF